MKCPKCQGEQHCPCKNCKDKNRGKVVWKWITGNGPIECGHCGYQMPAEEWEYEEYRQFDKNRSSSKSKGTKCQT